MIRADQYREIPLLDRLIEHVVRMEPIPENYLRDDLIEAHRRIQQLETRLTDAQAEILRLEQIHSIY
jgi:hypothetical protein